MHPTRGRPGSPAAEQPAPNTHLSSDDLLPVLPAEAAQLEVRGAQALLKLAAPLLQTGDLKS